MMSQFKPAVRRANLGDIDILTDFNCRLARETEGETLNSQIVRDGVRRGLERDEEVVYFIAEVNSDPAGALMLTREWSDWRNKTFWWIQSVYVHPDYRNQGIFKALYKRILSDAKAQQTVGGLRLYVEQENEKAHLVYRQLGMKRTSYQMFEVDWGVKR